VDTVAIPALADNAIHVVVDSGVAVVFDPGESVFVLKVLDGRGAKVGAVLLTHWHSDHVAGAAGIRKATGCRVIGPAECEGIDPDRTVDGGDVVNVGPFDFMVMATPGHTFGHVCYRLEHERTVWTGDTLFVGGCGRILEGTPARMWQSLCRLRQLPPETVVHAGHDYTLDNLEFAAEILPGDSAIARMKARMLDLVESGRPAASSTIGDEREANIFLRADTDEVRAALGMSGAGPVEVFTELRRRKDSW
jgi:hydroxyacylglutathione hydrolase